MGLRMLPKPKPVSAAADLLQFLVTHLVWCDSVFADEKQRFYLFPAMNLSCISGCQAVSLFDTRRIIDGDGDGGSESHEDIPSDSLSDDASTLADRVGATASRHDLLSDIGSPSSDSLDDSDDDTWADTDVSGDVDDHIYETQLDHFSDLQIHASGDSNDDSDVDSDISSVTDDGFLAGNEETGTILWRHVSFYVIRSPVAG
jgi:hypothetical protein